MTKQITISHDEKMEKLKQKLLEISNIKSHMHRLKSKINFLRSEHLVYVELNTKQNGFYDQETLPIRFMKPSLEAIEKLIQGEIDECQKKLDKQMNMSLIDILTEQCPNK